MEPNRFGRVLGISARVAARTIRERVDQAGQPKAPPQPSPPAQPGAAPVSSAPLSSAPVSSGPAPGSPAPSASLRSESIPTQSVPTQSVPTQSAPGSPGRVVPAQQPRRQAVSGGRRLARGAGRFGAVMLQPVIRAGGALALQITGVFFALFALFFLSHAWQSHHAAGWHDVHTRLYAGLGVAFTWFTISSFWRARRKAQG